MEVERTFSCISCGVLDMTIVEMKRHNARIHPFDNSICSDCLNAYHSDRLLAQHLKNYHTLLVKEETYFCVYCDESKGFETEEALKTHTRAAHGRGVLNFLCGVCKNWFATKIRRSVHQKSCKK